ncbi:MAG TPA: MFS transporter [Frankiaceae bacterium]|nr:MFS transporter [Frankiaceae bacterium]
MLMLHPSRTRTFRSLRIRNYRLYLAGQAISLCGTWMQTIAQGWLVLTLTRSGTALGLVVALQFLPMLLLGPYGGLVADRVDRRRLLVATQAALAALAALLGLLDVTGAVRLWMVFAVAAGFGLVTCVDMPTRQSFVMEMVGRDDLPNAVTLNSVLVNAARAVGPAVAGALIAVAGTGACFLTNAASYLAVIVALLRMDVRGLYRQEPVPRARGQVRAGLAYVARTPALRVPLVMMAVIGTLAYEFQVVLPLVAERTFGGGAGTYGALTAAMGAGAVAGGLLVARRRRATSRALVLGAAGFGAVILLAAAAPTLPLAIAVLVLVGAGSVAFLAVGNATLQLAADPGMRGRVMALWGVAFLGTTPLGGPIAGWVGQHAGPRWALALGGAAAVLAAGYGAWALRGGRGPAAPGRAVAPAP